MATQTLTPWTAMLPLEADRWGADIFDPATRRRWCGAIMLGGLPYIWNVSAAVPRRLAVDKLAIGQGDDVLIIGEAVTGCGFDSELAAIVGETGTVTTIDFMDRVRDLMLADTFPQWDWSEYTRDLPDESVDAIAVFQGVAHAEDWHSTARELRRVLKPGGALVMAEVVFGPGFESRVRSDVHSEYFVEKLLEGMGIAFDAFPYWSPAELEAALSDGFRDIQSFAWRGVELTWASKL
jgi:SAM-dependent methyltransferase